MSLGATPAALRQRRAQGGHQWRSCLPVMGLAGEFPSFSHCRLLIEGLLQLASGRSWRRAVAAQQATAGRWPESLR